jgi:hypothetical protein
MTSEHIPPPHAMPEVPGPNSFPTGERYDTSSDSYAAGWPDTPTITESAKKARRAIIEKGLGAEAGSIVITEQTQHVTHMLLREPSGGIARSTVPTEPLVDLRP